MHQFAINLLQEGGDVFLQEEIIFVLMLLAISAVAILVRRVRIPYTVALVLVGLGLALLPTDEIVGLPAKLAEDLATGLRGEFTSELILTLLVPPLIFEAALHLSWSKFKQELLPIFLLAVPGVLVSTIIVAEAVSIPLDMTLGYAFAFGALISATDPVAVISFFRSLGVDKRLAVLVEGESLLNDGVSVVLFTLAMAVARGGGENVTLASGFVDFLRVAGGGLGVGLVTGFLVAQILEKVDDHLIETTLTMALAFGSFVMAETLDVSGILAVVAAGILVGSISIDKMSATTKITLENFWELLAFIATSAIFLILGLQINIGDLIESIWPILLAVAAILASRAIVVYSVGWVSTRLGRPIPLKFRHIMYWGGLRGAISLALALSVTGPFAGQIRLMTFGVVLFTLLVQGLSIERLIKRLKLTNQMRSTGQQRQLAQLFMLRATKRELDGLHEDGLITEASWRALGNMADEDVHDILHEHPDLERTVLIETRRDLLRAKRAALAEAYHRSAISAEVYQSELHELDERILIWEQIEESFVTSAIPAAQPASTQ